MSYFFLSFLPELFQLSIFLLLPQNLPLGKEDFRFHTMAPVDPKDVNSLSDEQLSDMLRDYGVDVGPINGNVLNGLHKHCCHNM